MRGGEQLLLYVELKIQSEWWMKKKTDSDSTRTSTSITTPVLRPISPSFVNASTIEHRLAKHHIDLVVRLAKPPPKRHTVTHIWWTALQSFPEILRTVPARI